MNDLDEIFSDELLVRIKSPRRNRRLSGCPLTCKGGNPQCGDEVEFQIKLDNKNIIEDIAFSACGCMLSVAGADAMCELCCGKCIKEALNLTEKEIAELLPSVIGIRKRCALLGFETLKKELTKKLYDQ